MTFAKATFPSPPEENITYTYRPFSERGARGFVQSMNTQDWTSVLGARDLEEKVTVFQSTLDSLMDEHFPLKTTTRRKTDPPWVNEALRRLTKKRRRVYDREGRSKRWRALKRRASKLYRERAAFYMKTQKQKLTAPDACRAFYKNVKSYSSREKPPDFNVRDLYPGEADEVVAENLAEHFNAISKEFNGITEEQIPTSFSSPLPMLTEDQVKSRLTSFRKPKSMVLGDIFPSLVNRVAAQLAVPLTNIFNDMTATQKWPSDWKREFVTPIPKTTHPENPNDLRNISCTKLFSKVYESFILTWLTDQAKLRSNQYGGVRGLGTEHFLINLWQKVLEDNDDSRGASLLTSIDYAKAFNRLDFVCCLKALKGKGVSQELINIVASFLTNRLMVVKVGNVFSQPRTVEGGVPQGSLLGVLLFNITIDNFEAFSRDVAAYGPEPVDVLGPIERADYPPIAPVLPPITTRDYKHLPPFEEMLLEVQKYVDDNILIERLNFDKIRVDGSATKSYHATRTQNLFNEIVVRALYCGMKVNSSKTNALLISELKSYVPEAFFFDSAGQKIKTKEHLKVLGVHFSSTPDMQAQVKDIRRKFNSRMWVLRHLAHRGFTAEDLLAVYKSTLLPCHDYCSVVYHSSLTKYQSDQLERLQAQALKCIYGYQYSYRELLLMTNLKTLRDRREDRCTKFAVKSLNNPALAGWFPTNNNRTGRHGKTYQEFFARPSRLQNSPLFDLRRRLNNLQPSDRLPAT